MSSSFVPNVYCRGRTELRGDVLSKRQKERSMHDARAKSSCNRDRLTYTALVNAKAEERSTDNFIVFVFVVKVIRGCLSEKLWQRPKAKQSKAKQDLALECLSPGLS